MSPQTWHKISYILLTTGIIFFVVTVILALKFQLLNIIRSEMQRSRRKNVMSTGEEYLAYIKKKSSGLSVIDELSDSSNSDIKEIKPVSESGRGTVSELSDADDSPSATVVISSHVPEEQAASESATVVTSGKIEDEGFRITDSIMVIHGDPHAIRI